MRAAGFYLFFFCFLSACEQNTGALLCCLALLPGRESAGLASRWVDRGPRTPLGRDQLQHLDSRANTVTQYEVTPCNVYSTLA